MVTDLVAHNQLLIYNYMYIYYVDIVHCRYVVPKIIDYVELTR